MKRLFNSSGLIIGLILVFIGVLGNRQTINNGIQKTISKVFLKDNYAEKWQVKPGSIYDGDTLRVVRGNEELKIRFCGIDAPEKKMPLGVESRDHLRSLVDIGNGELLLVPVEQDRYGRTVAEVYVKDSRSTAINLNVQMVRDGYAWHYEKYSNTCPIRGEFAIAQEMAQKEGLGIWKGNPQPPWEFRQKANK